MSTQLDRASRHLLRKIEGGPTVLEVELQRTPRLHEAYRELINRGYVQRVNIDYSHMVGTPYGITYAHFTAAGKELVKNL